MPWSLGITGFQRQLENEALLAKNVLSKIIFYLSVSAAQVIDWIEPSLNYLLALSLALASCYSTVSAQSKQGITHYLCRESHISDEFPRLGTRLTIDWTNRRFTFNNHLGWYDGFTMKEKGTAIYWEGERPNHHNADRHYARWTIDVVEGYITQRANDYS